MGDAPDCATCSDLHQHISPPCQDCAWPLLNKAFHQDWVGAWQHWSQLETCRPMGFGMGMIPITAVGEYLRLLGESREMLKRVMTIERVMFPLLVKAQKDQENNKQKNQE